MVWVGVVAREKMSVGWAMVDLVWALVKREGGFLPLSIV